MSRDTGSNKTASPTLQSLEARQDQLDRPTPRRPLRRRRAEIARICEELGFDGLAARVESAPDAICVTRMRDGMILALNDRCEQMFGYSSADHAGRTTDALAFWDDPAGRERFVTTLRTCGEITDMETRLRRSDGVEVPVLLSGRVLDVRGEPFILSVAHDITKRMQAEDALRRSEEHYRTIVTAMDEAAVIVDRSGTISSVNPAAERISGFPAEEMVGQSLGDRVAQGRHVRADGSPLPVEEHPGLIALGTGEPRSHVVMGFHRPDGSLVWISVNSQPLLSDGESGPRGSLSTYRDITANVAAEAEIRRREAELERLLAERESHLALVQRSLTSAVRVIGEVVEARDPYTAGHQRRVSELATRIAQEMQLPAARVEEIRVAALIHDVGKMAVPIEILNKPGPLSVLQFTLIKSHAEVGHGIVSSAGMPGDIAAIVHQHHERCDGSGYPRGLSGDALLPGAKVLMVADVVEAMASHRPHRTSLGLEAAVEEIESGAGVRYDTDVCRACIAVVREQGFAFSESQTN